MALQFSLLGGPELPLRATPPTLVDVPKAVEQSYVMQGNIAAAQEKIRTQREAEQDRQIIKEGLKSGTLDLFTPKGIEQALVQLRGQVSPEFYLKLGEQARKAREADLGFQQKLATMDTAALTQYNAGIESSMPYLDALLKQYRTDAETGGEESARAKFADARKQMIGQMQGKMVGPNTPMFNPQVMQALQTVSPEMLPGMLAASKYQTEQIKNALNAARAQQLAVSKVTNLIDPETNAVIANIPGTGLVDTTTNQAYTGDPTKLRPVAGTGARPSAAAQRKDQFTSKEGTFFRYGDGRNTKLDPATGQEVEVAALPTDAQPIGRAPRTETGTTTLRGSDGNQYLLNRRTGETAVLDRATGQYTPLPGGVPPDVTLFAMGGAPEAQAAARRQRTVLSPEEAARLSRITRMVDLKVPPFGQGEAGTNARNQFYKSLLADIDAQGQGDTQAAIQMAMARASRRTRETIIQRDAVLRSEEDEAKQLLGKIEEELKKIGGPASPYLREKWNTVETRILGEPTFSQLNLYMTQFVDTVGRLSSNATGAAGTPVAYLNFAKTVLDKDFNLGQIQAFRPAFDELLKARRVGVRNAFTYLNELGAAVTEAPKTAPATGAQPTGQQPATTGQQPATTPPAQTAPTQPATTPPQQPAAQRAQPTEAQIARTLRRAGIPYEPDIYDYRVNEDGSVARRRKAQ